MAEDTASFEKFLQERRLKATLAMKELVPKDGSAPGVGDLALMESHALDVKQATEVLNHLRAERVRVRSEPLTYREGDPKVSYYRDLLLSDRVPGAADRLQRHTQEMDVIRQERETRAWRSLHSGEMEYRVEPNRTQGYGGYFTVPLWLNQAFATANRAGRVLASLMRNLPLPAGVSSVNLPIIVTGTVVQPAMDTAPVVDQDITDAPGSSTVATLSGDADVSLQLLEQSPGGAHLDWALFQDLSEAYDEDLETQLLTGRGSTYQELLGITKVIGINSVTYTDGSPSGSAMFPYFGKAAAQIGDNRKRPPECWLMRTARWAWLSAAEDTAQRPFSIPTPFYIGRGTSATPDPVGGLLSFPVFADDAIPADLGTGADEDVVIAIRPSDLILLEATPVTAVMREPGSGNLSARIQMHNRVAAITNRKPAAVSVLSGSGLKIASGF